MSGVVSFVVSGPGCYKNLPFNNYNLRLPEGGTIGEVRVGGRAVVKLADLSLKVDAIDISGVATVLILVFSPQGAEYTFDPTKVLVHTAYGSVVEPTWYIGPGRLRRLYRDDRGCLPLTVGATRGQEWLGKSTANLPQLERRTDSARDLLAVDDTCFVLRYQARVVPPAAAWIEFGGLARNGLDVPVYTLLVGAQPAYGSVLDVRRPTP